MHITAWYTPDSLVANTSKLDGEFESQLGLDCL